MILNKSEFLEILKDYLKKDLSPDESYLKNGKNL